MQSLAVGAIRHFLQSSDLSISKRRCRLSWSTPLCLIAAAGPLTSGLRQPPFGEMSYAAFQAAVVPLIRVSSLAQVSLATCSRFVVQRQPVPPIRVHPVPAPWIDCQSGERCKHKSRTRFCDAFCT